ncbi:MAG TPA: K(+)-transporting ATPase subunit C [Candidatus Binataceae bacterium]|nr:K(+)-transporting ATPase subunit C [Candidatus Binataceae bacterium]
MRELWISIRMTVLLTVLLGLVYPVAMTAIGQVIFPRQAGGSLIARNGAIVGSELMGQSFTSPKYFHSRPSAAGNGYDPTSSGGSNLGPTSKALIDAVSKRVKDVMTSEGVPASQVPIDLVTASGSGLDPDISPAAADIQAERIAKARGVSPDTVRQLIQDNTHSRWLGLFGEPGVNVLTLNLALDAPR